MPLKRDHGDGLHNPPSTNMLHGSKYSSFFTVDIRQGVKPSRMYLYLHPRLHPLDVCS